jgi:hypothetical protein
MVRHKRLQVRWAFPKRFPYRIVFVVDDDLVNVLCVVTRSDMIVSGAAEHEENFRKREPDCGNGTPANEASIALKSRFAVASWREESRGSTARCALPAGRRACRAIAHDRARTDAQGGGATRSSTGKVTRQNPRSVAISRGASPWSVWCAGGRLAIARERRCRVTGNDFVRYQSPALLAQQGLF